MDFDFQSQLIDSLGSESFSLRFFDLFLSQLLIDQCTAWELREGQAPKTLVSARPNNPELIKELCEIYSQSMYQKDRHLNQANQKKQKLVAQVSLQSMDNEHYRHLFFEDADLQEKIFIINRLGNSRFYINLYRCKGRPLFTPSDLERCRHASSYACSLLQKHKQLSPELKQSSDKELDKLEAFFRLHPSGLSPREACTCSLIIGGYSNEAIALKLGISINTARTFRRRAYEKLGLSTQAELFAAYLQGGNIEQ